MADRDVIAASSSASASSPTASMRQTGESAIHDLGYRRYEGARIGAAGAWRSLLWHGFRTMFGLGRTAKAKVIPVFIVTVTMLPALASLSAYSLSQGTVKIQFGRLIEGELLLFVLFAAAQAPELLSRDQQHRVLPLILTRDVTRLSYASARFAAIVGSLFLVAFAPLLLLYIGEIGASADPARTFSETGGRILPMLAQAALTAITIGGVASALAAWTPRRAYATAAVIGSFLVAAAVASGIDDLTGLDGTTSALIDPVRTLQTQAMVFFGEKTRRMERIPPPSLWTSAAVLTAIGAAGWSALMLRIQRLRT